MFETLKYEVKNNIGFITIDRPEALNAISMTVLKELHSVFEQVNDDPEVKVAILTGNGKAFVAGADIDVYKRQIPGSDRIYAGRHTGTDVHYKNYPILLYGYKGGLK